jgi:predicted nucleic acid-binding protein
MSSPGRANCFDASALVKLYTEEEGSDIVRPYFEREATKYATPFCFYEALNVLKVKWQYRKQITRDQYLDAAFRLTA